MAETIQLLPGLKLGTKELVQAGGAIAFSAAYGAYEALWIEDFLKNIGNYQEPVFGEVYPYHIGMLAAFLGVAFGLGHDPRLWREGPTGNVVFRTALNMLQLLPPMVVMEDVFYFIFQYFDKKHPETYGKWNLTMDAWTCKHMGCTDAGITAIPNWYYLSFGGAYGAWLVDNVMFPEKTRLVQVATG
jgi:hypothetical protein